MGYLQDIDRSPGEIYDWFLVYIIYISQMHVHTDVY